MNNVAKTDFILGNVSRGVQLILKLQWMSYNDNIFLEPFSLKHSRQLLQN